MKKLLAGGTLAVLVFGGFVATAAPASAHKPDAVGVCDAAANVSYVSADAVMYPADASVVVTIDGTQVEAGTFEEIGYKSGSNQTQYEYSYSNKFDTLDPTIDHTWSVSFDSPDGQGVKEFGDTIAACVQAAPTPEPSPSEPPVTEPEPSEEPTPEPSATPSEEAVVPSAEPSASPSPAAEEPPVLAATGATVGGAIAFAALLAAGGIALVWARKRMQNA
ncbi:hypothetical protein [Promicromonospora soli]|uniref:LPXTG-motif cell wall-anchored protein n=1 Tax=Promicromonospora soli TaxID=2035533 RepID=A0A919FQT6_9MICO|nr:hypothetical protein [Promicromonospora soli]GHH70852.1 hypothetical protein GCM10017772_18140 [Promicromonospora soli]